jgi:mono/diheme cytochrome c family protein
MRRGASRKRSGRQAATESLDAFRAAVVASALTFENLGRFNLRIAGPMARHTSQRQPSLFIAALLPVLLALAGCGRIQPGTSEGLTPREALKGRDVESSRLAEGKKIYEEYCVGCHGVKGDGKGVAARFLDPAPRDFTSGIFKFAAVPSGQLPRDEDLLRTLRHGLPGSSMPSWQLLSEQERLSVLAYIKTFSPVWKENAAGNPIAVSDDPYRSDGVEGARRAVARGREVYHVIATCWQCHPTYATQAEVNEWAKSNDAGKVELRADAARSSLVTDGWGRPLMPPDFPKRRMKAGTSLQDLYRTIGAGIGGTAMPMWKDGLEEKDLWALVYYVKSLADQRLRRPGAIPSGAEKSAHLTAAKQAGE